MFEKKKNAEGFYQLKRLNTDEYLVLSDEKCIELRQRIIDYYHLIKDLD